MEKWEDKKLWGNEKVENGKRNSMSTKFSQYFHKKKKIISDRLLQVVIGEQKSNFNGKFKLELIIIYQIWFVVKHCKYVVDITLLEWKIFNFSSCMFGWGWKVDNEKHFFYLLISINLLSCPYYIIKKNYNIKKSNI